MEVTVKYEGKTYTGTLALVNPEPTPEPEPTPSGAIVFEAESATVPSTWLLQTEHGGYSGNGYIVYTAGNSYGSVPSQKLTYSFNVPAAGKYKMVITVRRDKDGRTGIGDDEENDVYAKVDSGSFEKVYMNYPFDWGKWVSGGRVDRPDRQVPTYDLSAGTHTLQLAGRSTNFKIDSIRFEQLSTTPTPEPEPEPEPEPQPDPVGLPTAATTGPRYSFKETRSGFTATEDGAVYERINFTGDVKVKANNVTFRDCKMTGIKFYDEQKYGGFRNILVEYCEVTDPDAGTLITFGHGTVRRCYLHDSGADAINVHEDAKVIENYITKMGMKKDSHADGISGSSPDGKPVLGVVIRGNNIDMPHPDKGGPAGYKSNWCVGIGKFGTLDKPTLIEGNMLNGGNATLNSGIEGAVIMVRNNKFGRQYKKLTQTHTGEKWEDGYWINNTWADTGALIPKPT